MILTEKQFQSETAIFESIQKTKDIKSLILQYLQETGMKHSAFCFGHEANVAVDKYMTQGRLLNLVEKGIEMEQKEKESEKTHSSALPITTNRSSKQFKKKAKGSQKYASTHGKISQQLSLEELISSQVQLELQKLRLNPPSENSIMSQTLSNYSPKEVVGSKVHPRRKKNLTYSNFGQVANEVVGMKRKAKGRRPKIKGSRRRMEVPKKGKSPVAQREPKSILKSSNARNSNFSMNSSNPSDLPKTKKSITIKDIKSLNCSEIKQTSKERISSSRRYETQRTINLTDEVETTNKKKEDFLSAKKEQETQFNEGFSFGGSEKEEEVKTPKKSIHSSHRKTNSYHRPEHMSRSMFSNTLTSVRRASSTSSEECITSAKYFFRDSGSVFEPYEFRAFENHVVVFDRFFKKLCVFDIPRFSNRGVGRGKVTGELAFFSLTESFSKKSPFFTLNKNLVFYTATQFIAFDYK